MVNKVNTHSDKTLGFGDPAKANLSRSTAVQKKLYRTFSVSSFILAIVIVGIVYVGWTRKVELDNYITAESGLGYWLGVSGGVLFLLMPLYSVRKRIRLLSRFGHLRHWLRIHMMFGIIGPVIILYHSNFHLGSTNSTVALAALIIIVTSGFIGRYLYGKINYGLYNERITFQQLQVERNSFYQLLEPVIRNNPNLKDRLREFENVTLASSNNVTNLARMAILAFRSQIQARVALRSIRKGYKVLADQNGWSRKEYKQHIREARVWLLGYVHTVKKIAELSFFERLFSLWHVMHVPLFVLFFLSVIWHVDAVHRY